MKISSIFSYLVYPAKQEKDQPLIGGAQIPLSGNLYNMLKKVFLKADEECDIPICFRPEDDEQQNSCLDEIVQFINATNIENGRKLAQRMQSVTTSKSGLGLLFLIKAQYSNNYKFLISRFPADQGIIAEQDSSDLKVEFIEKVFLKNAYSYKAALYKGHSLPSDFWLGYAVDKQINHGAKDLAKYWIKEFLLSDFKTTSKAGTKRLAVALKNCLDKTNDINVKEELTAAAILASKYSGNTSISQFSQTYNLSDNAKKVLFSEISSKSLLGDMFEFSREEFSKYILFKSVELDNGAVITALLDKFEKCFKKEKLDDYDHGYRFTTQGIIINEKLRKIK